MGRFTNAHVCSDIVTFLLNSHSASVLFLFISHSSPIQFPLIFFHVLELKLAVVVLYIAAVYLVLYI